MLMMAVNLYKQNFILLFELTIKLFISGKYIVKINLKVIIYYNS